MSAAGAIAALALSASTPGAEPSGPAAAAQAQATAPVSAPPEPPATTPDDSAPPFDPLADDAQGLTVESAYRAAQARRGSLDGRWRLSDGAGAPLFDFQLSDPGAAPSPASADPDHPQIEGAWRDLRREGALAASGFLASVQRDGETLELTFAEGPRTMRIRLKPASGPGWSGELDEGAGPKPVFLDRQAAMNPP